MSVPDFMIYGATGFSGELVAREAVRRGLRPLVAGRRADAVTSLAEELGLEPRVFSLDDPVAVRSGLEGIHSVLHCAGPFLLTSKQMVDACLDRGVNYLDITGEVSVFESIFSLHERAVEKKIILMPGVGFDVIPTDCLAGRLKEALPDATELELAFTGLGTVSRGTMRTMVMGCSHGGWIRRNGRLESVPLGWKTRRIPFADRDRDAVTLPWGDLSTAYRSTGIGNIRTYAALPKGTIRGLRRLERLRGLLAWGPIQGFLSRAIGWKSRGPKDRELLEGRCHLWGEVTNRSGEKVFGHLSTPDGYRFTALGAIAALTRIDSVQPGAWTPAQAFGAEWVESIEGVEVGALTRSVE
ncbi:MAG: saccharopine dehydrogenase NADP-binding domain-containing protein [Planctomycetota bacterium]|nr:saccharopine dehydrogenase NADP-binding domain-containing protein [Planctomycetota bacterium]